MFVLASGEALTQFVINYLQDNSIGDEQRVVQRLCLAAEHSTTITDRVYLDQRGGLVDRRYQLANRIRRTGDDACRQKNEP